MRSYRIERVVVDGGPDTLVVVSIDVERPAGPAGAGVLVVAKPVAVVVAGSNGIYAIGVDGSRQDLALLQRTVPELAPALCVLRDGSESRSSTLPHSARP
jgi:uncharacterized spore protein YtfJ